MTRKTQGYERILTAGISLLLALVLAPAAYSQDAAVGNAIAQMDKYIAANNIAKDKLNPGWKQRLPKPPKAVFDGGDTDYFWNIETNKGLIKVKLWPDIAPMHVSSTIYLARLGFYDSIDFHRVITGFMAQGGCPLGKGSLVQVVVGVGGTFPREAGRGSLREVSGLWGFRRVDR